MPMTPTPGALMRVRSEPAQPVDDARAAAGREQRELAADADRCHRVQGVERTAQRTACKWIATCTAEEIRKHGAAPQRDDAVGEAQHLRRDAGHLGQHEHGRAGALGVDVVADAAVREGVAREGREIARRCADATRLG
jgi:hypothetical protein